MRYLLLSAGVLALFFIQSCQWERQIAPDGSGICFEKDILPVFQTNCTQSGCHNAQDKEEGFDLTTYAGIIKGIKPGNAASSIIYKVLIETGDDRMPKAPYNALPDSIIERVKTWIDAGANNTTDCQVVVCDTATVTFNATIKPIFTTYCTGGCHSGAAPSFSLSLDSYNTGLQTVALDGSLYGSLNHESGYSKMPKGGSKLSACELAKVKKWVDAGAPNN